MKLNYKQIEYKINTNVREEIIGLMDNFVSGSVQNKIFNTVRFGPWSVLQDPIENAIYYYLIDKLEATE